MVEPIIFHIDVNSAFLSWTACDMLTKDNTCVDIREIPSIVGGNQASRHGIVLAKSGPAKKYGIITGEPVISARKKCPNLTVVPPNYSLYVDCSNKLMELLLSYTPDVEQYSIDEAFCDFTGFDHIYGKPMVFANELKDKIRDELGFTVNIGVSNNKLLAKMASDFKKPDLVHSLFPWEIEKKMWPLPISDLFFVGKATEKKLRTIGLHTIGEVAKTAPELLVSLLKSHGRTVWNYANGHDLEIDTDHVNFKNKGYGNSTTIRFDVTDSDTAKQYLLLMCESVGMRMRADSAQISVVAVSILDSDFNYSSHQMTLSSPTDITDKIWEASCKLFDEFWNGHPIRQIGVHTHKATRNNYYQYSLFDLDNKNEKLRALDSAVDNIRERYGHESIKRACFIEK